MVWLDYVILGVVAVSTLISLMRGFVREALALFIWALAFGLAWSFHEDLAPHLANWIENPSLRQGAAFVAIFLAVQITGGMVSYLVVRLMQVTGLSGTDRLVGMVFGAGRGILLVAVLVLVAGFTPLPKAHWWQDSQLVPYFEELAIWLRDLPDQQAYFRGEEMAKR